MSSFNTTDLLNAKIQTIKEFADIINKKFNVIDEIKEFVNEFEEKLKNSFIEKKISESLYKKWIKKIPLENQILFEDFKFKKDFKKVASIEKDKDFNLKGDKIRSTVIKFIPENKEEWNKDSQWIYIFTINNKIVKIGGTRTGLSKRAMSYLCGHHIPERKKSGKCSVTNAYIYNTFDFYLENNYEINMYGYIIPNHKVSLDILGEIIHINPQTYHIYETKFLEKYKKQVGNYPFLSDNSDPIYK